MAGWWRLALVDGDTLVYLTARRLESGDEVRWELGAIGHGPSADELTEYLCDEIRSWAPERNRHTPSLNVAGNRFKIASIAALYSAGNATDVSNSCRSPAVRRPFT